MRYFKHFTTLMEDEAVSYIRSKMGIEGYGIYVAILEIVSSQVDGEKTRYSVQKKQFIQKLGLPSERKLNKFLKLVESFPVYSVEVGLSEEKPAPLFEWKEIDNILSIDIPKLKKIRDEWSDRKFKNSGVSREEIGSDSGETREKLVRKREDKIREDKIREETRANTPRKTRGILSAVEPDFSSFKKPDLIKQFWQKQQAKASLTNFYDSIERAQKNFAPEIWQQAIEVALCAEVPWGMAGFYSKCQDLDEKAKRFGGLSVVETDKEQELEFLRGCWARWKDMANQGKTDAEIFERLRQRFNLDDARLEFVKSKIIEQQKRMGISA
jgi:hypothetical protein